MLGVCAEIDIEPEVIDVGSIGATCNISLNQQGLLAGLLAEVEGLAGKPIESVEKFPDRRVAIPYRKSTISVVLFLHGALAMNPRLWCMTPPVERLPLGSGG